MPQEEWSLQSICHCYSTAVWPLTNHEMLWGCCSGCLHKPLWACPPMWPPVWQSMWRDMYHIILGKNREEEILWTHFDSDVLRKCPFSRLPSGMWQDSQMWTQMHKQMWWALWGTLSGDNKDWIGLWPLLHKDMLIPWRSNLSHSSEKIPHLQSPCNHALWWRPCSVCLQEEGTLYSSLWA